MSDKIVGISAGSVCVALFIVFFFLDLVGIISLPWFLICAPILIPVAIILVIIIVEIIGFLISGD